MLAGSLFHMKRQGRKVEDMKDHERAVACLSDGTLVSVIEDLRHSSDQWCRARRAAALDEAERRGLLR